MSIHIERGQTVKDNEQYLVLAPTGDYEPVDLLECSRRDQPTVSVCMFQAQCIQFGNSVYQQDVALTKGQLLELSRGTPLGQVLNNSKLIGDLFSLSPVAGKIVDKNGVKIDHALSPDSSVQEQELDEEPDTQDQTPLAVDTPVPTDATVTSAPSLEDTLVPEAAVATSTVPATIAPVTPEVLPETPVLEPVIKGSKNIKEAVEDGALVPAAKLLNLKTKKTGRRLV